MLFRDRREAGQRLGAQLQDLADRNVVVLALPRGGVPVGFEVAQALDAPLNHAARQSITIYTGLTHVKTSLDESNSSSVC